MRPGILSKRRHRDGIRPSTLILSFLILIALLSGRDAMGQMGPTQHPGQHQTTISSDDVIPGVVVVKLKRTGPLMKGAAAQRTEAMLQSFSRYGVTSLKRMFPQRAPLSDSAVAAARVDLSQIHCATIPTDLNPVEIAAQLAALPGVEYAEPRYNYRLCDGSNDSDYVYAQQVYFDRMHVAEGWTLQKGSRDVVIATVDGGTNWQHPDLAANMWINPGEDINHSGAFEKTLASAGGDMDGVDNDHNGHVDDVIGWNFGSADSCDPRGFLPINADHGTGTASDFGAVTDNGRGMAGTSWNCRVMAVCASHATVDDNVCYWLEGIEYASRMGARVINCSFYRAGGPDNFVQSEQDVITAVTQQGVLIVAAAGNNYGQNLDTKPWYPASFDHVLSVGATKNSSDEITYFTNYGLNVSVFAPGVAIHVARDDGSYGTDQGTSHSSPLVAGLAGLLFAKHPDWTPDQVAEQIRMTADPIDASNPTYAGSLGHGRVNFYRALSEVHSGVVVTAGHFQTPSGRTMYVEGDTVTLSVKLKNVLTLAAENLSFNIAANSALVPLGSPRAPTRLDAGAEDSLDCMFLVGSLNSKEKVQVRLGWSMNAGESDAHMFNITLYPGKGYWEYQKSPTSLPLYDVHAVNERVIWAVGNGYERNSSKSVILRTTDGGENWVSVVDRVVTGNVAGIPGTLTFVPLTIAAVDSLHAWVAGGQCGMIFKTIDGGISWSQQSYPPPQSYLMKKLWFFDALNGYAWGEPLGEPVGGPGKYVIVRTTDGGTTWEHLVSEPFAVKQVWEARAFCCTDKQHIWLGTPDSLIWRTTDGGNTWLSARVGNASVTTLAMRDDSVGIACSGYDGPVSFWRTADGGATWQELTNVKPEGGYMVAFPPGPCVWIGGLRGVTCSRDNGVTWSLEPTEPIGDDMTDIAFLDSEHGWMVTYGGQILRYRGPTTEVEKRRNILVPGEFRLEQNYPNPFNPVTTIKYTVGGTRGSGLGTSKTMIAVYDLLGRQVSTLVDEAKAPGSYEVTFDSSRLASGVYICRMTAGAFRQSRKMLLIK